ncbi:MAG: PDC sensor domain-containing protein [Candidatus Bathyarchaeota archaeon]|nr:PDC sensor domain-containing protein [Candidatus Bathyarchaeota archaeon]
MRKAQIIALLLTVALVTSVALNFYQYTQNASLKSQNDAATTRLEMSSLLTQTQLQVNEELKNLDDTLTEACNQLSTTDLQGTQTRQILSELAAGNSLIVNAATCDDKDILLAVEPSQYSDIEGEDISSQEQNIQMHQTLRPAMSDMILLVEGFYGVVIVAPIFDADEAFVGSLSIVIQPSQLIKKIVEPATVYKPFSFFAMQTDGRMIYDADPKQEGKMTFSDPAYQDFPELLALAQKVSAENDGYGTYTYHPTLESEEIVQKEVYWATLGIYRAQWRLVILHTLNT